jgi:23S rRNA pseudouridine955/2504/2580 synthase
MERRVLAGLDDQGRRLDRVLRKLLPGLPLSALYRLLRSGDIRVNGRKAKPDYAIEAGDELRLWLTDGTAAAGRGSVAAGMAGTGEERERAARFARLILAETKDIVVVNKPRGLLSHGEGGLDTLALAYFSERMRAALAFTPAPLHRLDRNTSGALAVSASMRGAREFSRALREGRIQKLYLALLDGELERSCEWRDALRRDGDALKSLQGGAADPQAHALFEPLAVARGRTLARIRIYTGLTHQIRAQAALRGYPLSGDLKYGGSSLRGGYMLHSHSLAVPTDLAAESPGAVHAPLPEEARRRLEAIFGVNILNRLIE